MKFKFKRCPKSHTKKKVRCRKQLSIRNNTWLSQLFAPLPKILQVIYYWSKDLKIGIIAQFSRLSRKQVWAIVRTLRYNVASFMVKHPETTKIGGINSDGESIYVQIDETACGKRKANKGKRRETVWTLGGIEMPHSTMIKGQVPRSFAVTVPNRSRETLIPILLQKIHQKSIIWSDGWKSYFILDQFFKEGQMVNHSQTFKNKETGVNTNRCEGIWLWMKQKIKRGTRKYEIEEYIQLFNFKQWSRNHPDFNIIGHFGMLGRVMWIMKPTRLINRKTASRILNYAICDIITTENPYVPPPPPPSPKSAVSRKRGRPKEAKNKKHSPKPRTMRSRKAKK